MKVHNMLHNMLQQVTVMVIIFLVDHTHLANPGAQQADTHLSVVVQVGVEAPAALGQVIEEGGHRWVDVGQLNVKQEEGILVWRARWALDQRGEQVLVHAKPGSV